MIFDSTLGLEPNPFDAREGREGSLPDVWMFPFLQALGLVPTRNVPSDSTTAYAEPLNIDDKLSEAVDYACKFAEFAFSDIEPERLKRTKCEALILAKSGLFEGRVVPEISIDPYGEVTFSHRSDKGYVDIGVRGENELSFHVRNDADPELSGFGDVDWTDFEIPPELTMSLQSLRRALELG